MILKKSYISLILRLSPSTFRTYLKVRSNEHLSSPGDGTVAGSGKYHSPPRPGLRCRARDSVWKPWTRRPRSRDPAASDPECEALKSLVQLCMVRSSNLTFNYIISVISHVHLTHSFKLIYLALINITHVTHDPITIWNIFSP